jgi:hypothetical protein
VPAKAGLLGREDIDTGLHREELVVPSGPVIRVAATPVAVLVSVIVVPGTTAPVVARGADNRGGLELRQQARCGQKQQSLIVQRHTDVMASSSATFGAEQAIEPV